MGTPAQNQHRLGLLFVTLAALAWSQSGVFTRLISADLMTMLFWRGLFSGTAAFTFHCLMQRRFAVDDFGRMGWPGLVVCALSAGGMMAGIGALRFTAVADAMVIYATLPFITAGLAFLVIGEKTGQNTIIASAVALSGVLVMLLGSDWGGSLFGKFLAVLMTLCMAGFSVVMRGHRELPMLPALAGSAWLVSFVTFWFALPLSITAHDFMLVAAFGVLQNAAGLAFYSLGTTRIPAAEATLLAALEVPFTPLWVWLFLGETPSKWTLVGGFVVLVALFTHIYGEFRRAGNATELEFTPAP